MSKIMGKKQAFLVSQAISILGYISLWFLFIPGKPYMFIIALPFHSFGIGSLFVLMMSMTADVIDMDELNTGLRREGIFGAIYWWMVKFGFAIAGGLSGVILSVVGFNADLGQQSVETLTGLRLFYSGVPIMGTLIAIAVMWNYDVTEEKANEVRAEIARKKATKKSTAAFMRDKLYSLDKNFVSKPLMDLSHTSSDELKSLFVKAVNDGVHGMCFSPYEADQQLGDHLSRAQIERRMANIAPSTRWVRSFSCSGGNEPIPEVARTRGLKTMVGAWISNHPGGSQEEVDTLLRLANNGCVDIAVVGNEVLLRGELSEEAVIDYIRKVKDQLPPGVKVGYVDAYYQFIDRPALVEACDVVLVNLYPYWEGIDNEGAGYSVQRMYELSKQAADGKEVIIAETGWPSQGKGVGDAHPSEENAMKFFISIQRWAKESKVKMFYFSSFDEPWKVSNEGEVGAHWGLWDKDEQLKYGVLEKQV
jgi:GPH family glycoside/pentoside/hexuronide:cation symporter